MTTSEDPPQLIVICSDLLFSSRITAAATRAGVNAVLVPNLAKAESRAPTDDTPVSVLVDLSSPGVDFEQIAKTFDGRRVTLAAFGPHVHTTKLEAAEAAGFRVFTRGALNARLDELLRELAAES